MHNSIKVWEVICILAIATFAIRFSFLGLLGDRKLPDWALRLLRYTPVAVLPGLVAPHVVWPAATNHSMDPPRMLAAIVTVAAGLISRNFFVAIGAGAGTLALALWSMG